MGEKVILVNEEDEILGYMDKLELTSLEIFTGNFYFYF